MKNKSLFYCGDQKYFVKWTFALIPLVLANLFISQTVLADNDKNTDENLLNEYIKSKGTRTVVFDSLNIKQFWIDNSVFAQDNKINIILTKNGQQFESVPLKIQLANVTASLDCKIEVIADNEDISFSVFNDKSKVISTSSPEEAFLEYYLASSTFHLDETADFSFSIKFNSKFLNTIPIKKIILSFDNNKAFLTSPGVLKIDEKTVSGNWTEIKSHDTPNSFSISGKRTSLFSNQKILVGDKPVSNYVTIKNIGETATRVYFAYVPFTITNRRIEYRNNLYKEKNDILTVISSELNSNKIIVNAYSEWEKGCYLVSNAKKDLSDFPNCSFIGSINEVKKISDEQTEITFDKNCYIKPGTNVRIQSKDGPSYIYTHVKLLEPGEEVTLSSTMKKDDSFLQFSNNAFCRGTYYITPLILSYSVESTKENTILVCDFTVSY